MDEDDVNKERAQVAIAEFVALRGEIANRTNSQNTLVSISLVATSAIGALIFNKDAGPVVALLLGPLCTATGLLWLDHASAIFSIGDYIKTSLWPYLENTLRKDLRDTTEVTGCIRLPRLPSYERYVLKGKKLPIERGVLLYPFSVVFIGPVVLSCVANGIEGGGGWIQSAIVVNLILLAGLLAMWRRFLSRTLTDRDKGKEN